MNKILNLLFYTVFLLSYQVSCAQFTVSSTGGSFNPALTYASLTNTGGAFAAINVAVSGTGAIVITVTGNSLAETGAISIKDAQFLEWTSLRISPDNSNWTISGSAAAGTALINFDGADNVNITGLLPSNNFTIRNTNDSALPGTSTIRFANDAKNNIVQFCVIEGSSTSVDTGTILFDAGTDIGNRANVISTNIIRPVGVKLPCNGIFSAGVSTDNNNAGGKIQFNTIQDFFSPTTDSNGIYLKAFSSGWDINQNTIQQTAARTFTNAATARGIYNTTTERTNIVSNQIGGATTTYTGPGASSYVGIYVQGSTSTVFTINNGLNQNTIAGISLTTASGTFTGIDVRNGFVDVNTNIIGSISATSSINVVVNTPPATGEANFYGIKTNSTTADVRVFISYNNIAGINLTGSSPTVGTTLFGILNTGTAQLFCENNWIGINNTINSIICGSASTTATCIITAIKNTSTGTTGPALTVNESARINSNNIYNCTLNSNNLNSYFYGIENTGGTKIIAIRNNTLSAMTIFGKGESIGIQNFTTNTDSNITANYFDNIKIESDLTNFTAIKNGGTISNLLYIDDNVFGSDTTNFLTYSIANSGELKVIENNSTVSSGYSFSIGRNVIQKIIHTIGGSTNHYYIANYGNHNAGIFIASNIFKNLNLATSGSVRFIRSEGAVTLNNGNGPSINSNIVNSFIKTLGGGVVQFFYSEKNYLRLQFFNFSNNNLSNMTVTGNTPLYGAYVTNSGNNWK